MTVIVGCTDWILAYLLKAIIDELNKNKQLAN